VGGKIEHLDAKSNGESVNPMAWKHAAFQPLADAARCHRFGAANAQKWQKFQEAAFGIAKNCTGYQY